MFKSNEKGTASHSDEGIARASKRKRAECRMEDDASLPRKQRDNERKFKNNDSLLLGNVSGEQEKACSDQVIGSGFARVYIGNLHPKITSIHVEKLFSKVGPVLEVNMFASRGYAFCEMKDPAHAEKAVAILHKRSLMGRPLTVRPANEKGGDSKRHPRFETKTNPQTSQSLSVQISRIKKKLHYQESNEA